MYEEKNKDHKAQENWAGWFNIRVVDFLGEPT